MHAPCQARLSLLLVLVLAGGGRGAEADAELAYAEKILDEAKVATDGLTLLQFFRDRTLAADDLRKLADKVRLLGDNSFAAREKASRDLVLAGRVAVPYLRAALRDPDAEIARRAEHCLQAIEQNSELIVIAAAARLLAARKPEGALQVLLDFLPSAQEESVEEAVQAALAIVGLKDGQADTVMQKALTDKEPSRRLAAAFVLARGSAEQRAAVRALLTDADARVRWQAATALARVGEKSSLPSLIALLSEGPVPLAWRAEDLLLQIAGDGAPSLSVGAGAEADRIKCRAAWQAWWKDNEAKADLSRLNLDTALLGLTVVCECDLNQGGQTGGLIWECGSDGKPRWQMNNSLQAPVDVQFLSGDRVLIADGQAAVVTERSRDGKILWTHRVNGYTTTCRSLANGNTFIASYAELVEVTPEGKVVSSFKDPRGGSIYRAQRLRNDHILYVNSAGLLIELDAKGKEVRSLAIPGAQDIWAGVEQLPNGRFLVCLYNNNKVLEIDTAGKVHWQVQVQTPSSASRLSNGHTLVSSMDARRIVEFDRHGKEVWKQATQGRPFRVLRH